MIKGSINDCISYKNKGALILNKKDEKDIAEFINRLDNGTAENTIAEFAAEFNK